MFVTQENNESSINTEEDKSSSSVCINCKNNEFIEIIDGYDFDTGEQPFKVETCTQCKLSRTAPLLDNDKLSNYYAPSSYGSSENKFNKYFLS